MSTDGVNYHKMMTSRRKIKVEKWKVFYYNDKELCAYTLKGTFNGEEQATKEFLAKENGINIDDIVVKIEIR